MTESSAPIHVVIPNVRLETDEYLDEVRLVFDCPTTAQLEQVFDLLASAIREKTLTFGPITFIADAIIEERS
ncbi:MAG: hypothetical protein DI566_13370 [Microbacterium sp.]|nr:MAG: hypothetical protein DI566_13370 [Microbacterium sp.]